MAHCYFDKAASFPGRCFCLFHLSLSPAAVAHARKGIGIRVCGSRRPCLQPPSCRVPRFASSRRCTYPSLFLPFPGLRRRKIHIAGQIEIIHYLNSVATTVRDLLVDVAPDSPLLTSSPLERCATRHPPLLTSDPLYRLRASPPVLGSIPHHDIR